MSTDPMIERALQEGARNQEVHGLIRNWCANARIEKFGGVGMLEQLTGYPIGHHSMACDFAALPGPATWDLAEAALAFHDNQCATCTHRKPAGFPNLSKLVAERDDRLAVLQASAAAAEMTAETARLERRAEREALRALLAPVSASLVDQLSALDEGPSPAATQALVETAKLAADTFEPAVIEHLFQLLERLEPWALDASLLALKQLRADPPRLARGAMVAMAQGLSVEAAATVIADLAADVNPESIGPALANLAALATRDEDFFLQDQPAPLPQALLSLHRRHAASVEAGLEDLLAQNAVWPATLAARGLLVIARESDEAAVRCARAVLSKLARGTGFSEYGEPGRELLYPLRDAAARAYLASPEATEALMQKFLLGASEAGYGRIFSVYGRVLGGPGRSEGPATDAADDVALRRVLLAIQGSPPDSALREIQSLLQARVGERGALAARHIDGLIGAAILLDDQLDRLDSAMNEPAKDALNAVTLGNRRSSVTYIQRHLVRWAASGAAGAPKATADYLDLLAGLPEDRERLRALLIGELDELAVSPETFGLVLPVLYGALVGASVSVRGAAARLVGKLGRQRRNDAPPLLMEAFVELLHDPFWYVIKAAVDALGRFSPPDAMKAEVGNMLYQLVRAYGEDRSRSEFIVECLDLLIHRHLTDAQLGGPLGHWVVEVLGHHAPEAYARELPNLGRALGEIPEFGGLVLKALLEAEFHEDEIVRALRELAPQTVALNRKGFLEAALGAENLQAAGPFVETFSKVGDWEAAEQVAAAVAARQPSTVRARYRRVTAEMLRAAAASERAIAEGRLHDLPECAQAWRDLRDELVGEQS